MPPRLVDLFDDADVLQWSGNLLGGGAQAVLLIAGSEDAIVLVAWSVPSQGAFRNLLRVAADGAIVWRASLPTGGDSYVSVEWHGPLLIANSWSGYSVEVDVGTGRPLQSVFTK
jgi:hypothetical protein